jgi:lysophospholipase L1-like esterase
MHRDRSVPSHLPLSFLAACLLNVILVAVAGASDTAADRCLSFVKQLDLGAPLPQTREKLRGRSITIVALGSSSTAGFGTFGKAFPEVMKAELAQSHPSLHINLIVSGRLFDTIPGSIARLEKDALRYKPDLVIWQLGTNDTLSPVAASDLKGRMRKGIEQIKRSNAEVILMDLQYAPVVRAMPSHTAMQSLIADVGREESVAVFSRYALMKHAIDDGVHGLVAWDGLHNSAAGYRCIGRALARMIDQPGTQ